MIRFKIVGTISQNIIIPKWQKMQWMDRYHSCRDQSRRHKSMMTSSNGNIFFVTGYSCGEFTGDRWFPRTKASDAELWYFLSLNQWLSKQSRRWRFQMPSRSLWRHCNVNTNPWTSRSLMLRWPNFKRNRVWHVLLDLHQEALVFIAHSARTVCDNRLCYILLD